VLEKALVLQNLR